MADLVVVTGGSGFLAGWCVRQLLEQGHDVRVSLRPGRSVDALRAALAPGVEDAARLTAFAADLGSDTGWAEGLAGARYVLHVASPTSLSKQSPDELAALATAGTMRVVSQALASSVERVVLTSSTFATAYPKDGGDRALRGESDWTDTNAPSVSPYVRAKTLAERAAWDCVREGGVTGRLATVNPGGIIGPLLSADVPDSMKMIAQLAKSDGPAMPRIAVPWVDVRDVADLHIRAMRAPAAGGQRYIASSATVWADDLAAWIKAELATRPAAASAILSDDGVSPRFSSKKARVDLGWQARPLETSLRDAIGSLANRGLLPAP